jgi:hypothetical protein
MTSCKYFSFIFDHLHVFNDRNHSLSSCPTSSRSTRARRRFGFFHIRQGIDATKSHLTFDLAFFNGELSKCDATVDE